MLVMHDFFKVPTPTSDYLLMAYTRSISSPTKSNRSSGLTLIDPNIAIWPLSEPFDYGTLNVSLSSKVGVMAMKRIIKYCVAKGPAAYPNLSYMVWRHIACARLFLSEKIAWLYFDTFWLLKDILPRNRQVYEQQLARLACNDVKSERHKDNRKVDCLSFIVLLYLQQYNVVARRSLLYSREDWPLHLSVGGHRKVSSTSQPNLNSDSARQCSKKSSGSCCCNEDTHLSFIVNHLEELICLLSTEHRKNLSDSRVPLDCVLALDFILEGSIDSGQTSMPLHKVLMSKAEDCGYNQHLETFEFNRLVHFIKVHLNTNPYIGTNCLKNGVAISKHLRQNKEKATVAQDHQSEVNLNSRRRKIAVVASNHPFAPTNRRMVIIANLNKQTIIETSPYYENAEVKIHKCHVSYIYVLNSIKCAFITRCRNTTIVLPSVQTTVLIDQCDNINVLTACRRFAIGLSSDCTAYLLTSYSPIVLSGNQTIKFAPFNTNFVGLDNLINKNGLYFSENKWKQPVVPSIAASNSLTSDRNSIGSVDAFEFLSPSDFHLTNVPVKSRVALHIPLPDTFFPLPLEFQKKIKTKFFVGFLH
ncbi:hypothetical protein ACOME3_004628 [Neoechinorhynchus agilis]